MGSLVVYSLFRVLLLQPVENMVASWSWMMSIAFLRLFLKLMDKQYLHSWTLLAKTQKSCSYVFFLHQASYHQPVLKLYSVFSSLITAHSCYSIFCVVVCSCKPCLRWAGQAPFWVRRHESWRWLCDHFYNNLHCTRTFLHYFFEIN